ncbi:hypothetical protein H0E84_05795 [Luteimonas sp. SJ-92]|uniref:DUF6429 domain-containing protein n=1 Tax=Luteimonas salinisoli TaxID=2752307 RepID=A0A853JBA5_9GAMM|nr:DUF6429 family protein [Luteimonas salinisoli]NZA25890.1 hypothetical protein [Luteimonas salinisoli]
MAYDQSRIDDAVLALLAAHLFNTNSSWKGYDFDVMNRLHEAGYIFNPVGKKKSVQLTEDGMKRGQELASRLFSTAATDDSARHRGS